MGHSENNEVYDRFTGGQDMAEFLDGFTSVETAVGHLAENGNPDLIPNDSESRAMVEFLVEEIRRGNVQGWSGR